MEIKEVIEICELDYTLFPDDNEYLNEAAKILKKVDRGELVEVVRCKDCGFEENGTCGYWTDDNYRPAVDDMGYCDNGERK